VAGLFLIGVSRRLHPPPLTYHSCAARERVILSLLEALMKFLRSFPEGSPVSYAQRSMFLELNCRDDLMCNASACLPLYGPTLSLRSFPPTRDPKSVFWFPLCSESRTGNFLPFPCTRPLLVLHNPIGHRRPLLDVPHPTASIFL